MNNLKREIIGFLMGEGCFRISARCKSRWMDRKLFTPIVLVSLRDDDDEILNKIKEVYGGFVINRPADRKTRINANPSIMWSVTSSRLVLPICTDFLKSKLPSKKRREVELLKKVCEMKINRSDKGHKGKRSKWFTDEEYKFQEFAFEELKRMKKYKSE